MVMTFKFKLITIKATNLVTAVTANLFKYLEVP